MDDPVAAPIDCQRARLWPAVLATFLTGMGFASLKFVFITEIALDFDPKAHQPLSISMLEQILQTSILKQTFVEAVSQGMAAMLTFGVLVGFAVNSPIAGAWRVAPMFAISCLLMAAGMLAAIWINPWIIAFIIGLSYGTACAARGKCIPLVAAATGRHNTQVSGFINASLVVGLLAGTLFGNVLGDYLIKDIAHLGTLKNGKIADLDWVAHVVVAVFMLVATWASMLVVAPDPHPVPFKQGVRELLTGTLHMCRNHWALLVGGGMVWGIASAASLAVLIYGVDDLKLEQTKAATIAGFAAVGAILGNMVSDWFDRRRWVILCLIGLAAGIASFPFIVHEYWQAAMMLILVSFCFAVPANVLDARLLYQTAQEGLAGRGSTVMSLIHNVCILLVGIGLSAPLFLGWISAQEQFLILAGVSLATVVVSAFAPIRPEAGQ